MSAVFDVFISRKYRSGVSSVSIGVYVHGETWLKPVEHCSSNQDELPNGNKIFHQLLPHKYSPESFEGVICW